VHARPAIGQYSTKKKKTIFAVVPTAANLEMRSTNCVPLSVLQYSTKHQGRQFDAAEVDFAHILFILAAIRMSTLLFTADHLPALLLMTELSAIGPSGPLLNHA
jgi:hypothetical protein